MNRYSNEHVKFYSEIAGRQLSEKEFFSDDLLESIYRNFGIHDISVVFYDTSGNFLSTRDENGISLDSNKHPYHKVSKENKIRKIVYEDAVRDRLTYYNVVPRLYKSTDVIKENYEEDTYVKFLNENFNAHYSVTMAFGIDAYIEVVFFKSLEDGDFTDEDILDLNSIYIFLANGYTTYKKHEQSKIISDLQNHVIALKESAYIIIDDFLHVMNYNKKAIVYLQDVLGDDIANQMDYSNTSYWLQLLLADDGTHDDGVKIRYIKNYVFKIYTHDMHYSNKIIDRYHWITIAKKKDKPKIKCLTLNVPFTKTEEKVALLLLKGFTYNQVADELVISYHTVKKHVSNIYAKCGVNSRFELYKWDENNRQQT